MIVPRNIAALVASRAGNRCEYCKMHQALQGATFHVEHIIPIVCGGDSHLDNLAWACPSCNLRKASRISYVNPDTGHEVEIFHPRRHLWPEHFVWRGEKLEGLTAVGQATIRALGLNDARRLMIRRAETAFGLFPP